MVAIEVKIEIEVDVERKILQILGIFQTFSFHPSFGDSVNKLNPQLSILPIFLYPPRQSSFHRE